MRRVVLLFCVLLLATIAVTASAATMNLKVEDVGSIACNAPAIPSTSTSTTTTTTTTPTGCQTKVVCAKKSDNTPNPNENECDGNNGNPHQ